MSGRAERGDARLKHEWTQIKKDVRDTEGTDGLGFSAQIAAILVLTHGEVCQPEAEDGIPGREGGRFPVRNCSVTRLQLVLLGAVTAILGP